MTINVTRCEQYGANVGYVWQPGSLRYDGCEQSLTVFSVKGTLSMAGLTAVSFAVKQA